MLTYLLGFLVSSGSLSAYSHPNTGKGEPTVVSVQFVVLDIDNVDSAQQNFTVNMFYGLSWLDPRLVHEGKEPVRKSLDEIWHPNIQITNRQRLFRTMDEQALVFPDGRVAIIQRVWGGLSQILMLQDFPFDKQTFSMSLVPAGHGTDQVKFILNDEEPSGISPLFSLPDWEILGWEGKGEEASIMEEMDNVPMFTVSVNAERHSRYYVLKVILPMCLIVAMSWIVFWIDPEQSATQIGVATTSMLTLIAYRFSVDALVPAGPYFTRMDTFILISTLIVFGTLGEAVLTSVLTKHGKPQIALKMDYWCRFLVAPAFIGLAYLSFFH